MKRCVLISLLITTAGCATRAAPPPAAVRRIAVLPPHGIPGSDKTPPTSTDAPQRSLGEVLAAAARTELAADGYDVVDPITVATATRGIAPSSPAMAAQMVDQAHLDATAMYIDVPVWQPSYEGMRTDSIIVALDVMLLDPRTGTTLWKVHRAAKPVPLYGTLLSGQADVIAAETVMREILAPLRSPRRAAAVLLEETGAPNRRE